MNSSGFVMYQTQNIKKFRETFFSSEIDFKLEEKSNILSVTFLTNFNHGNFSTLTYFSISIKSHRCILIFKIWPKMSYTTYDPEIWQATAPSRRRKCHKSYCTISKSNMYFEKSYSNENLGLIFRGLT